MDHDDWPPRIWVPETVDRPLLLAARRLRRETTAAELAIELDGAQHHSPEGRAHDAERDDWLRQRHGITVLRLDNALLLRQTGAALQRIRQALGQR